MARIPEDVIEKIRDEVAIEEVVGHFLPLTRAGTSFKALCPFHQEKTPSFHVNPQRRIFYCFGCHRGGDVFRFLMDRQGMSYPEAIEWCAGRLGLDLSRYSAEAGEGGGQRGTVLAANAWAAAWFAAQLAAPAGAAARDYLRARGLHPETVEMFGLGLAPEDGGPFLRSAREAGYDDEALLAAGLLLRKEGRPPLAYFWGRLIFPVRGVAQKVTGFGGRTLGSGEPKYLNSPETLVFQKRRTLYALPEARAAIVRHKRAILVEGYVDALALHQAGWPMTVATCGTAFSPEQATVLGRYADRVCVLLDGDAAGVKAAFRTADVALASGLEVSIARLPAGLDPADMVRAGRTDELRAHIEKAPGLVQRLADEVHAHGDTRQAKERALAHLRETVAKLHDRVRAEFLLQEAADAFGVRVAVFEQGGAAAGGTPKGGAAPGPTRGGAPSPRPATASGVGEASPRARLEEQAVRMAMADRSARNLLTSRMAAEQFEDSRLRELFGALRQRADESAELDAGLLAGLSDQAQQVGARLLAELPGPALDALAELEAALQRMEQLKQRDLRQQHRARLNEKFKWGEDWQSDLDQRTRQAGDADA